MPDEMLITPDEVAGLANPDQFEFGLEEGESTVLASMCKAVTCRIQGYLNRRLLAHEVVQRASRSRWRLGLGDFYTLYTDAWPAVEVLDGPGGITIVEGAEEVRLATAEAATLRYVAGYRREDEDLAAVQERAAGATELPEVLPYDIREAALVMVIYRWMKRQASDYGQERSVERVGESMVTVDIQDKDFEQRTLAGLSHHMRVTT